MESGEKVVFKRRKVTNLRKRHASESDNEQPPPDLSTSAPAPTSTPSNVATPDLPYQGSASPSEQAINRERLQELRNRRRQPPKGISHSIKVSSFNGKKRAAPEPAEPTGPPTREDMSEAMVSGRFVKQTGLIVNDTRDHMNAYIDTKLREMRGYGSHAEQQQRQQQIDDAAADYTHETQSSSPIPHNHKTDDRPQNARQNALSGKIEEIDLGPQVARDNIARTQAAANRLTGTGTTVSDPEPTTTTTNTTTNRRRRPQKTAEQVSREKLVEQILGEKSDGRHMRYDGNDQTATDADGGPEHDDDALAEKFVRAWEEQAQGRVRRHHPPPAAKTGGPRGSRAEMEKQSRGPKLGGSRSARAALRAQEEAAAKGKLRR